MRGAADQERVVEADGEAWRASVLWRAADGSALCYFRPAGDAASGREDRRARLPAGRSLEEMDPEAVLELLEAAAPLTATERRFRAPDGREWLAQNVGPVWAEEDAAEGATGILFTSLDGSAERLESGGGHVGRMTEEALADAWRRAAGREGGDEGEEPGGDG